MGKVLGQFVCRSGCVGLLWIPHTFNHTPDEELLGSPHSILRHPDMPAFAFKELWDTVSVGGRWQGYVKNLRKDGGYYWVKATVIPNIRDGKIVSYTSIRRKPSRAKVEECIEIYRMLSAA